MNQVIPLQNGRFKSDVLDSPEPVLVYFGAEWCGVCREVEFRIHRLAGEFAGRARFVHVDVDAHPLLAAQYGVLSVPSVMIIHRGAIVQGWNSLPAPHAMTRGLERALAS
mgnify:FL=1